jgi:hypothetical protein
MKETPHQAAAFQFAMVTHAAIAITMEQRAAMSDHERATARQMLSEHAAMSAAMELLD